MQLQDLPLSRLQVGEGLVQKAAALILQQLLQRAGAVVRLTLREGRLRSAGPAEVVQRQVPGHPVEPGPDVGVGLRQSQQRPEEGLLEQVLRQGGAGTQRAKIEIQLPLVSPVAFLQGVRSHGAPSSLHPI